MPVDGRDGREGRRPDGPQHASVLDDEFPRSLRRETGEGLEVHSGGKRPSPHARENGSPRTITGLLEDLEQPVQIGQGEGIAGLGPIEGDPPDAVVLAQVDGRRVEIPLSHRRCLLSRAKPSGSKDMLAGYRITSSARPSTDGGIVSPMAAALFRSITRSNFVGCSMGRSPGLAPLRILST